MIDAPPHSNPYFERLMAKLAGLGYRASVPPRRLVWDAPNDIVGFERAQLATPEAPIDLGEARLLAVGRGRGDHVVVRINGRGDYYGALLHGLFLAGSDPPIQGRLMYAHNYCVLWSEACTPDDVKEVMRSIPLSRDTIS